MIAQSTPLLSKNSDQDQTEAQQFYRAVLDWSSGELSMRAGGKRPAMEVNGQPIGGYAPIHSGAGHWLTYVTVDNVDDRVTKARKAGAMVQMEPMDMPGIGRMAIITDPFGATFASSTLFKEIPIALLKPALGVPYNPCSKGEYVTTSVGSELC